VCKKVEAAKDGSRSKAATLVKEAKKRKRFLKYTKQFLLSSLPFLFFPFNLGPHYLKIHIKFILFGFTRTKTDSHFPGYRIV
jgi:hypothetical protein